MTSGHSLDFVVLGTARSGTTALGKAINLDPRCFCSTEYFHGEWKAEYASMAMPEAFQDPRWKASTPQNTLRSRKLLTQKLGAGTVQAYGNKHPSYFLIIDHLHRQLPNLRSVALYRTPAEIAASWDKRAGNPEDRWVEGRTGIYGILEWLIALGRFAAPGSPVRVLDYTAMFYDDATLMPRMMEFIAGFPAERRTVRRYERGVFRQGGRSGERSAPLRHAAFLAGIGAEALDAAVRERAFFPAQDYAAGFGDFYRAAIGPAFSYTAQSLMEGGNTVELEFAFRWVHNLVRIFDDPASEIYRSLTPLCEGLLDALAPKASEENQRMAKPIIRQMRARTRRASPAAAE